MIAPTTNQFPADLSPDGLGAGGSGIPAVERYMARYNVPRDAQRLLRRFWEISDFPESLLVESLKKTADTGIDDDYSEFLRGDVLLESSLAMIGFHFKAGIDAALQAGNCQSEKIARVAALFQMPQRTSGSYFDAGMSVGEIALFQMTPHPSGHYLCALAQRFSEDYPVEEFAFMLAEAAMLLCRADSFLRDWGRRFARIADRHPSPMQSIANIVGIAMRGEALQADSYRSTHRSFTNCENAFVALLDDTNGDNGHARGEIWRKKRMRILDELGGR